MSTDGVASGRRSSVQSSQRDALEAWVRGLVAPDPRAPVAGALRERRREAAQHEAVVARVLASYDAYDAYEVYDAGAVGDVVDAGDGGHARARPAEGRAGVVVAHRQEWTRGAVSAAVAAGAPVLAAVEDGAAALGAAVALQPEAVLVEQQLPWLDGLTVVRGVRALCPATCVVVHLDRADADAEAVAAGAHATVPRTTPPRELADRLLALLQQPTG